MSIKSVKPTQKGRFRQGYYKIINPDKYIGDSSNIIYRSSWEHRFCRYCDRTDDVTKWSSEPVGIKYISPVDGKEHTYYVDFYMHVEQGDEKRDILVEIKPAASLLKPVLEGKKITTKKLQQYNYDLKTWLVNRAKFSAAIVYAQGRGFEFKVITESFLFS